jgi:hypothetical protein
MNSHIVLKHFGSLYMEDLFINALAFVSAAQSQVLTP